MSKTLTLRSLRSLLPLPTGEGKEEDARYVALGSISRAGSIAGSAATAKSTFS